jgi:hypothetical protein
MLVVPWPEPMSRKPGRIENFWRVNLAMTRIHQRDDGPSVKIVDHRTPSERPPSQRGLHVTRVAPTWHKLETEMSPSHHSAPHTVLFVVGTFDPCHSSAAKYSSLQSSLLRFRSNRACAEIRARFSSQRPDSFRTRLGLGNASTGQVVMQERARRSYQKALFTAVRNARDTVL